jgi:Nif-specific regulatory protein
MLKQLFFADGTRVSALDREAFEQIKLERDLYGRLLELGAQEALAKILEDALALIVEITASKKGYLALYEEEGDPQKPRWWRACGVSEQELVGIRRAISGGIIAEAMATGKTLWIESALEDPRFRDNSSVQGQNIEAVVCAPIGAEEPIGVLYLQGRAVGAFSERDRRLAEVFARHLALFVDRLLARGQRSGEDPTAPLRSRLKLSELVGQSPALAAVLTEVEKAARFEITVLLKGASGTGKTALARAIHDNSPRAGHPFVELNCAAIPENLFESELFGALPGAHSTATRKIPGKISAAQGGTLFLDEVGELPLAVQAKLLQLLQSKEYFPLGGTKPERADVRLIAATNADLEAAISQKGFREDLYYRLKVMTIRVPSLAERQGDIPLLLEHFCEVTRQRYGLPALRIAPAALRAVEAAEWPGNVRQLAHAVEVAAISAAMDGGGVLERRHLLSSEKGEAGAQGALSFHAATKRFQKKLLSDTLEETDWNVSEAARRLELTRSHVHNLIQSFELKRR